MSETARPAPIPIVVVTGFLGAGKTTLLNRLLPDPALADSVVIINEFGEIGLDHLLVETADEGLMLLSSGCLCCTVRGDLIATLEDLLRRRDNARMPPFRRVLIETTGLADPAPVLQAVLSHPYLAMRYALAGVVTLVDAVNGLDTIAAHEEALKQVAVADRLVLTKSDLDADGARTGPLVARLRQLNPMAPLVDAARDGVDASLVTGLGLFDPDGKGADVRGWLNQPAEPHPAHHDHGGHHHHGHEEHGHEEHGHDEHGHGKHSHTGHAHAGHAHDVNRHDARIRAFCLARDEAIEPAAFEMFLDLLRSAHGPNLLRVKGIVALADDRDRPVVIQGVQHVFHPPVRLAAWPDADRRTRIVFILRDLDESFVAKLWDAFCGRIAPDTPDRAALTQNPLSLTGGGFLS